MTRPILRLILAGFYFIAGVMHLIAPEPFVTITPSFVPLAREVVIGTGIAELLGSLALVQPRSRKLRQAAGIALALYALCVWPANINHFAMDMAREDGGLGLAYHVPRMIAQPIIIWWALWSGEIVGKKKPAV